MSKLLADKHPIINWFIHNAVSANLLMLGILLSGLYMVGFFGLFGQTAKLRLEAFPTAESTTVNITASINGSAPEDVEQGVTNKLEEALQGIQGIEKITSSSSADSAVIWVDAITGYDMDKLLDDIKTQVDAIGTLPAEVEKILVNQAKWQPSILWVTLHGDVNDKLMLSEAKRLKNLLLQSPYIEKITIDGENFAEIQIDVAEDTLKTYGLTLTQVASAINDASLDLSSGSIDTSQGAVNLRIKAQARQANDYANLIIRAGSDGSQLRLGDIATVTDGFGEQEIFTEFNGQTSLTLRLKSGKNANVIEADQAATDIVNHFIPTLPNGLTATIWNNRVSFVKDRIDLFVRNSSTGIVLVFLLLTLFLNLRLAFWVALGIPVAFTGALLLMSVFDISISLISLFGFILVLGIVVDDAIIIGESIYSWKKRLNNAAEATLRGAARVSTAATFGVLTTVAAFLPLTQIDGEIGNILGQIGAVVIFCLLFSLVESKLILPAHLHSVHVATHGQRGKNLWVRLQAAVAHGLEILVEKTYLPVLSTALKLRYFSLLVFISMFILAIGTIIGGIVPVSIMPRVESQDISMTVAMDSTVNVKSTIAETKRAVSALRVADQQLMTEHGSDHENVTNIAAFNLDDTHFMIRAGLAGAETRNLDATVIANRWRQIVGQIPGAKSVEVSARRRFSDADIEIQVLGNDSKQQQAAANKLIQILKQINGVQDIKNSQNETHNEIRIHLKPEASTYGISKTQLARNVRAAFYGQQAERLQRGDDEIRVMVRYPKTERQSLTDLYQLNIRTDNGALIPLSAVAELSFARSPTSIEHIDGRRALTVSANVNKAQTSVEAVIAALSADTLKQVEKHHAVSITFGGETEEDAKASASMQLGFIISLVMIYVLLAIPLKSYLRPLIIMSVIPFGVIGAIIGHLLLGMTLSMLSVFGIIALSGVVVNDSLLLMSSIQQYRAEGMAVRKAITVTGVRRFRPVILTSITTFAGLIPMLFETSFQAQFLIPMAVSLGFGILFATTITLLLVPVLYAITHDIKQLFFVEVKSTMN